MSGVAVLGADGYLGWHLTLTLAERGVDRLILVDSGLKRRLVAEMGFQSALPIGSFDERLRALREAHPGCRITLLEGDVSDLAPLILAKGPDVIYHLAQIPSSAYSMMGFDCARRLVVNNEIGHLAVLHAAREIDPGVHIVKMGSMGEYADLGLTIPDGYCSMAIGGEPVSRPMIFPREARDLYHLCKINETNFSGLACRVWKLRITEVMLSIVFGTCREMTALDPRLAPRLDLDPVFGTVIHRLVAQRVAGHRMSVYGGGVGLTSLTSLGRTLEILAGIPDRSPPPGCHDIVNVRSCHRLRVRRLAEWVDRVALDRGYPEQPWSIDLDPRREGEDPSASDLIETRSRVAPETESPEALMDHLHDLFRNLESPEARLAPALCPPEIDWRSGKAPASSRLMVEEALPRIGIEGHDGEGEVERPDASFRDLIQMRRKERVIPLDEMRKRTKTPRKKG